MILLVWRHDLERRVSLGSRPKTGGADGDRSIV